MLKKKAPEPCQLGHKCMWGRFDGTKPVCQFGRCVMVPLPKNPRKYVDRMTQHVITVPEQ